MIGGVFYKNIANPLVVNGEPLISLARNEETGILGVSVDLYSDNGQLVCRVIHNDICDLNEEFFVLQGSNRASVINKKTGQVFLDLSRGISDQAYELELSFLNILDGYPFILHPERTKLGTSNENEAPNISRLTITSEKWSQGAAVGINNSKIYLLGMGVENLLTGLSVRVGGSNGTN
ncbi:hypothetical protein [Salinicola sp. CR57]|uniref:hypothetical protein n=1 Tax=Salinicola sp. CR57 TaxID=1949086 RepID=UPI0013006D84|nr:hypothetical protein [Salinicola sp. CR57]